MNLYEMDSFKINGWIFKKEYRVCGKPNCKCQNYDQRHGPYWYRHREDSYGKKVYVGKKLPKICFEYFTLIEDQSESLDIVKSRLQSDLDIVETKRSILLKHIKAINSINAYTWLSREDKEALQEMELTELLPPEFE